MDFGRSELFRFCDDYAIRESVPQPTRSRDPNYVSAETCMSKDIGIKASEILRNLPRERTDQLLGYIRDVIKKHRKYGDRNDTQNVIKNVIKDFLRSLGYYF